MTPLQEKGFADQNAGALDPVLAVADTPEGREYRDGVRQARRDAFDAEQGPEVAGSHSVTCAAFSEPEPKARKPKKEKPADAAQGDLFA